MDNEQCKDCIHRDVCAYKEHYEYEPFIYPPTNRKLFLVYVSEKSHIAISADKWEKTEDCLLFYRDGKVISFFNTNNIAGMCESTTADICITKL